MLLVNIGQSQYNIEILRIQVVCAHWSAYFVRVQLTLSRYIHMHICADKQDIAGGQAEEKEAQMKMLRVMPATGLLMKIDNKKIVKLKHRH